MANLLDSIKEYVTPELIGQAAGLLGENEGGISKAVGGLAPTILAGLLNKTGDSHAMGSIFNALSNFNPGILDNLGSLLGGGNLAHNDPKDAAGHFLGSIFGAKVPAITNAVAAFSGTKSSSVSTLLGMVGPLVMGLLNKKISTDGLNVSGFANLLQTQKSSILGALPTGLGSILGLADIGGPVGGGTEAVTGNRWLWPLLLLLGIGGSIIYYMKYCSIQPEAAKVEAPAPAATPAPEPAKPILTFATGTQEAAMLAFVRDANAAIDKNKWFDFPEIMFDVNKATLRPESEVKLNAVLAILNEYPAVKLRIGGYTDTDGNDKANLKLSDERAKTCLAWLTAKGIAADRLEAEGYGEQHPVAPNDTPENKAKNRRISFSVR
ncbi:MAG TPA: OmpA family protein, partial [Saprospiraceae bacterium]|nr:OmpA family protein [Saprospiraceae bacterium]